MNIHWYKRNGSNLGIVPELPQWFIVDSMTRKLIEQVYQQGKSVTAVLASFSKEDRVAGRAVLTEMATLLTAHPKDHVEYSQPLTNHTTVAMIAVTRSCNLHCPQCYVNAICTKGNELSVEKHAHLAIEIKQVLTQGKSRYRVNLTGGEPFRRRDIMDVITVYHDASLDVGMSTNAMLIPETQMRKIASLAVPLSVSLDGAYPKSHDKIRGKGAFVIVKDKIRRLVQHGIRVGINYFLHRGNFGEIEETISLAHQLGCSGFNPINLVRIGRACKSGLKRVSEQELFVRLVKHLQIHPEHRYLFQRTSLFSALGAALQEGVLCMSCGVGKRPCIYVTPEGDVFPCPNMQHAEFRLGNVQSMSLSECINQSQSVCQKLTELRVDQLNKRCTSCDVRYFCGGDCRGETYSVTGSLTAPYPSCRDRHQSIIELMWIVAEHPELFTARSNEYAQNISRHV